MLGYCQHDIEEIERKRTNRKVITIRRSQWVCPPERAVHKLSIDSERVCVSFSTHLHPPERVVEVSGSVWACRRAGWRCAWVKEGSYGSQTRVSARYMAITAIDTRVQVLGEGRMKVETSILYARFEQTELQRKFNKKGKKVQDCAN